MFLDGEIVYTGVYFTEYLSQGIWYFTNSDQNNQKLFSLYKERNAFSPILWVGCRFYSLNKISDYREEEADMGRGREKGKHAIST